MKNINACVTVALVGAGSAFAAVAGPSFEQAELDVRETLISGLEEQMSVGPADRDGITFGPMDPYYCGSSIVEKFDVSIACQTWKMENGRPVATHPAPITGEISSKNTKTMKPQQYPKNSLMFWNLNGIQVLEDQTFNTKIG
eukprot:Clim_evm10s81 gene=Clim_evmTU10s81